MIALVHVALYFQVFRIRGRGATRSQVQAQGTPFDVP